MRWLLLLLTIALLGWSCSENKPDTAEFPVHSTGKLDHTLILVNDTSLYNWLTQVLQPAELLATDHEGQGTSGQYYLFLNSYIELLKLKDSTEAADNAEAFGSKYAERWSPGGSRFGFGLILDSLKVEEAKMGMHLYGDSTSTDSYYLMSPWNTDSRQPFVYYSPPSRAHNTLNSVEEVETKVDSPYRADVRKYMSHPSGIRKLTRVVYCTRETGANVALLKDLKGIEVIAGKSEALDFYFDDRVQKKELVYPGEPKVRVFY